jgi:hypothetical protein
MKALIGAIILGAVIGIAVVRNYAPQPDNAAAPSRTRKPRPLAWTSWWSEMDSNQRYALPYCLESVAVKWLGRYHRDGSREPVGLGGRSALMPQRDFLETHPFLGRASINNNCANDCESPR